MTDIDKHLDSIGPVGSIERLREIVRLDLGKRSEAAKRAIAARLKRMKSKYGTWLTETNETNDSQTT